MLAKGVSLKKPELSIKKIEVYPFKLKFLTFEFIEISLNNFEAVFLISLEEKAALELFAIKTISNGGNTDFRFLKYSLK